MPPAALAGPFTALAICGAASFVAYLDIAVVNVALPTLARELDASLRTVSWVAAAYNVVYGSLLVTAGRFADAHGRRRIFVGGLVVFAASSALCGAAQNAASLIAFRAVQGIGAAVLVPVSLALLLPSWPGERRGTAIGAWGTAGALAAGLGPPLGGIVSQALSWRFIFLVNVPIALGAALAARRWLPETPRLARAPLDGAGIALLTATVAACTLAVLQLDAWEAASPAELGLLAGVGAGALLLWRTERRAAAPVVDVALLRIRTFRIGTASSTFFYFSFFGASLLCVLTLQGLWGYSPLRAGVAFGVAPLLSASVSTLAGRLVDRHGSLRVGVAGMSLFAAGLAAQALLLQRQEAYASRFAVPLLVAFLGVALSFPALTGVATVDLPLARLATGAGVLNTIRQIGGVLGIAAVVAVLGGLPRADGPYREAYAVLLAADLAALVALLRLRGARRARAAEPSRSG